MSFFEVPAAFETPPPTEPEQPEWSGPPSGVLPGLSTQQATLFKTERAFLMVHRFRVYPTGLEFSLNLRLRTPDVLDYDMHWGPHRRPGPPGSTDDILRLGVLLSDGSKRTNLDSMRWRGAAAPEPPVVMSRGGGGGHGSFRMTYWMWPLPPAGSMTIVCEWPAYEVTESRIEIDATELRARAAEAETIWPQ